MAANTRTFAPPASINQIATATHFNKLDTNGTAGIRRDSSKSGYKRLPLAPSWASGQVVTCDSGLFYAANTGAANDVTIPVIGLVDGHVLTALKMSFTPKGGHGGGGPATLPLITLYKKSATGGMTSLGTATYIWNGAVDPAQYEAGFTLEMTALAHTVDLETYEYIVILAPEDGAGALGDLVFHSISANQTLDTTEGGVDLPIWLLA